VKSYQDTRKLWNKPSQIEGISPWWFFACIVAVQVLVIAFHVSNRGGFFGDEIESLWQANGRTNNFHYFQLLEINTWFRSEHIRNLLTVQRGERFDFNAVYLTLSGMGWGAHPPLHHMLLHAVSSIFPDSFSMWIGASINIVFLVAANVMLYKISMQIIKNKYVALLPSLFWVISSGGLSVAVFLRMYAMLTFFFLALVYLGLCLITGKSKVDWIFCVKLSAVLFFGFFTHYYFIILVAIVALFLFVWLLYKKDYKQFRRIFFVMFVTSCYFLGFWPHVIRHILSGPRGTEAFDNFTAMGGQADVIWQHLKTLNIQLFSGATILILIGIFIAYIAGALRGTFQKVKIEMPIAFVLYCSVVYFFIVMMIFPSLEGYLAGLPDGRFIWSVMPFFILIIVCFVHRAVLLHCVNKRIIAGVMAVICTFLVAYSFHNRRVQYMWDDRGIPELLSNNQASAAIVLRCETHASPHMVRGLFDNLVHFDKIYISETPASFPRTHPITGSHITLLFISVNLDLQETLASLPVYTNPWLLIDFHFHSFMIMDWHDGWFG